MKKYFCIAALLVMAWSCSDDDTEVNVDDPVVDNPTPPEEDPAPPEEGPTGSASVVINEVVYLEGSVELFNDGDINVDLSDYFLCLGPDTYRRIGDLETEGSVDLAPGEYLVIGYDMPKPEGGLGLYANNDGFGDAANIRSFVQWGAAGSPRENVAVEADIWTEGEFIPVVEDEDNSIAYDGEGFSASGWSETTTPSLGAENVFNAPVQNASVVINEVVYLGASVELYNNGDIDVDLSNYWICYDSRGLDECFRIGDAEEIKIVSGDVNLAPGEFLFIIMILIEGEGGYEAGGLGLYANNDGFGDAANIRSFVQWGAAGSSRENVAVEADIWTVGEYVEFDGKASIGNSIAYDGEGFSASDWSETTETTFGAANMFVPVVRSVVINEVEFLGESIIELYNNGTATVDLSNYWMCYGHRSGPSNQCFRVEDSAEIKIVSGNVNLAPGEFLVIIFGHQEAELQLGEAGGLALYANNDDFGDAANIRSFVQWEVAGSASENVAVAADIWTAGEFVVFGGSASRGNSIAYDGEGFSASGWSETTETTFGAANIFVKPQQ